MPGKPDRAQADVSLSSIKEVPITCLADLKGKKIASLTGTSFDVSINRVIPGVTHMYFNDSSAMVQAVLAGKVSAWAADAPVARLVAAQFPELSILPELICVDHYGLAVRKGHPLGRQASEVIGRFKKDGTMKAMEDKWFGADPAVKVIPDLSGKDGFDGRAGVIRFGHDTVTEPMSYVGDKGASLGLDVELAVRIAHALNMKIERVPMNFGGLIAALQSDKVDMVAGCMTITEERKKSVDFTVSYHSGGQALLVKKARAEAAGARNPAVAEKITGVSQLAASFRRTFVTEDRYKLVWQGIQVTLLISVLSAVFGTLLGFGVCLMRRAKSAWLYIPAKVFIRAIQGTPIVVLLMILYYVIFGGVDIDAVLVAIIGFSINFAAYVSEMMRTGIDAVDKGQHEAAVALGFNRVEVFAKITFPQAARHVLPVFKGEFISMLKATSIVGYIAIQDLTKMSDIIRSRTYEAFFPLIATALIYFAIAYAMMFLLSLVEVKVDPKRRARVVKGVARS
ncbi:MAG: ABC transporter permease subunit [Kiritimatiellae bacterium]|nr:ABC transporter permease subunit [Kiritimatiellia bacterium]